VLITTIGATVKGEWAWLDAPAAASYDRMLADGCPVGGITDAGRTSAEQWEMWLAYKAGRLKATAAYPGTSKHESGRAVDLTGSTLAWVRAHGVDYGWIRDAVKNEAWHIEYMAAWDTKGKTTAQEDDMPLSAEERAALKADMQATADSAMRGLIPTIVRDVTDAILAAPVDPAMGTGTVAQTIRDARIIARRTEVAVGVLTGAQVTTSADLDGGDLDVGALVDRLVQELPDAVVDELRSRL
jgi:hypothetical protein